MLAAMAKGPSYFSPDRYPERTRERFAYVLKRMQEDKVAGAEAINPGVTGVPRIVPYERPRREAGFHFVDHLLREAKTLVGMQSLTSESYTVRSTINSKLQRATEDALQDGLARYEAGSGRAKYEGPELNLGEITARVTTEQSTHALRRGRVVKPVWQIALQSARLPLYDVHWPAAVVLEQRRQGADQGRPAPTAASCRWRCRSMLPPTRFTSMTSSTSTSSKARTEATPRPSCASAPRFRARRWCWRTRPAASWRWSAASPIR